MRFFGSPRASKDGSRLGQPEARASRGLEILQEAVREGQLKAYNSALSKYAKGVEELLEEVKREPDEVRRQELRIFAEDCLRRAETLKSESQQQQPQPQRQANLRVSGVNSDRGGRGTARVHGTARGNLEGAGRTGGVG
eukprot:CAMPEP_0119335632 /NCGR_PEP_ID=MMETSP1333-20130426/89975_1 /TAXON_ID=418940 /ORGANISM="Scyphosphaera apsteinii, Strain RCC1455" /LENGTH=138 /DNA_ID=CAMNT_0007346227 /DNA_START=37 /DNA_END=450 /DNA_ORIENTATION=-